MKLPELLDTLVGRVETSTALDPVTDSLRAKADRLFPTGPLKDALSGTWLGHPLHPLLVAGPTCVAVCGDGVTLQILSARLDGDAVDGATLAARIGSGAHRLGERR